MIGPAALFHRFVEVPSITLGKAITASWRHPAKVEAGNRMVTQPVACYGASRPVLQTLKAMEIRFNAPWPTSHKIYWTELLNFRRR